MTRLGALAAIAAVAVAGCGSSKKHGSHSATTTAATASATTFTSKPFATGVAIMHPSPGGKTPVNQPDDITMLGGHIFVAFQNGIGADGTPTPSGTQGAGDRDSTIVEFSSSGAPVEQWDVLGHVDGLTADTANNRVAATSNEDANPHLYTITPGNPQVTTYKVPSALPHHGGFDAISFYHGMMLISASAPGTTGKAPPQAAYPAVYVATLNTSTHSVSVRGLFGDEATAKNANPAGGTTKLALSDPDSNIVVPTVAPRFGGDFELTSQGDYRQIFMSGTSGKQLSTLKLSQSIDDTVWASGPSGTLYVTDGSSDLINKITGPFKAGMEIVGVSPCDALNAPASCPSPAFPNNYLGEVNQTTGAVTKFPLAASMQPAGLLFVP